MTNYRQQIGHFGEKLARQFLERRDYKIITTNYYTRYGEIDLIAQKNGRLFFIEVKTRLTNKFGWPEEAVTKTKLDKLIKTAEKYIWENNLTNPDAQIDIISVEINRVQKRAKIKYWPNVT